MLSAADTRVGGTEHPGQAQLDLGRCRPSAEAVQQLVQLWSDSSASANEPGPAGPDRLWVLELASTRTAAGMVDVAVVIDVFSHRVLGWEVNRPAGQVQAMGPALVVGALRQALRLRRRCRREAGRPGVGQNRRVAVGVGCSDVTGATIDSLKLDGRGDVEGQVADWARRHNTSRIHKSRVGYVSPVDLEQRHCGHGPNREVSDGGSGSMVLAAGRPIAGRRPLAWWGRVSWAVVLRVLLCGSAAAGVLFALAGGWTLSMVLPTVVFGVAWWVDDWALHRRTDGGRR